jgi:hypothetical protein
LVAVAFLTTPRGTVWIKSRRSWGNAVLVEIGLYGDSEAGHIHVALGSWVWPEVREGTWDELRLRAGGVVPSSGEVQVPIAAWGWHNSVSQPVWGCPLPAHVVNCRFTAETDRPVRLLEDSTSSVAVDLVFLPRREIRARRLQIWSLKRRCRNEVPEPLRHVLTFSRWGQWPPERRKGQRYGA